MDFTRIRETSANKQGSLVATFLMIEWNGANGVEWKGRNQKVNEQYFVSFLMDEKGYG